MKLKKRVGRDLILLEYAYQNEDGKINFLNQNYIKSISSKEIVEDIARRAIRFKKINVAYLFFKGSPNSKQSDLLVTHPELTEIFSTEKSKRQINSVIYSWAVFVYNVLDLAKSSFKSIRNGGESNYFQYSSLQDAQKLYKRIREGKIITSRYDKMKIRMLTEMRILDANLLDSEKEIISENEFVQKLLLFAKKDLLIMTVFDFIYP